MGYSQLICINKGLAEDFSLGLALVELVKKNIVKRENLYIFLLFALVHHAF